eukprot:gene9098-11149_t
MTERGSRREKKQIDSDKLKSLESLKRARSGEKRSSQLEEEKEDNVKEEEEEEDYDKKRKNRDFIVGDDGYGYRERSDGEESDEEDDYFSDEEELEEAGYKKKKRAKREPKKDKDATGAPTTSIKKKLAEVAPEKNRIQQFLNRGQTTTTTTTSSTSFSERFKKLNETTVKSDTQKMSNLDAYLNDLHSQPTGEFDSSEILKNIDENKQHPPPQQQDTVNKDEFDNNNNNNNNNENEININEQIENDNYEFDFSQEEQQQEQQQQQKQILSKLKLSSKSTNPELSFNVQKTAWSQDSDKTSSITIQTYEQLTPKNTSLLSLYKDKNDKDTLDFFLLSMEADIQGKIQLFGKVCQTQKKPVESKTYASCCIIVENVERNVFFLPRDYILDEKGNSTTIEPTDKLIEAEIKSILDKHRITSFKIKKVKRSSCFDYQLPQKNIPIGNIYTFWKVSYPAVHHALPNDISGKTLKCAYGITSSPTELFILKRKIMGPSWLTISNPQFLFTNQRSWCRYEATVNSPKLINPRKTDLPSPPLVVMNISTKSVSVGSKTEVVIISSVVHENIDIDGGSEKKEKFKYITAIRSLPGQALPTTSGPNLTTCTNETTLLSFFAQTILNIDPDVIGGHNITGYDIEILFDRFQKQKVFEWSYIGRLKRRNFDNKNTITGRLICDSYLVCKEFLKEKNYSLVDLAKSQLNIDKQEINYLSIEPYFDTAKKLQLLIDLNQNDCFIVFLLMLKLNIFPLTKQLTNIAGNLWDKSLKGKKSERNEYLLLHNFHQKKFILPDKTFGGSQNKPNPNKKEAAYSGGLVLQAKTNFYDQYIVLLDFNSLYPSIIQEFNVCFTTVPRVRKDDNSGWMEAESPNSSVSKGILPTIFQFLVSKRREIKRKLNNEQNPLSRQQLDIQQMAVKLIANSIYGCLGFSHSRFYALPLAELVTKKGRENLQKTMEIVNQLNYDVVYGDTDSIMVNTDVSTYKEADEIGREIQKKINDKYRGSAIEIGLESIFKRLLLLKKKRYAALIETQKPNGESQTVIQNKGLDIVRRDWCDLTKDIGQHILDLIMGDEKRIQLFALVKEYLESVRAGLKENAIPIEKFIITKSLSRQPEDYGDGDTQPHVLVALAMRKKGGFVQPGDQIPYIITRGTEEWYKRAREPKEISSAEEIDTDWYLSQQILPPIQRITSPMGMEQIQLAQWLGMSTAKYNKMAGGDSDHYNQNQPQAYDYKSINDDPRYRNCKKPIFICPNLKCKHRNEFTGIKKIRVGDDDKEMEVSGFSCDKCNLIIPQSILENQITLTIRKVIKQFQSWELKCTECNNTSKNYKDNSFRCTQRLCNGKMEQMVNNYQLLNQIRLYEALFTIKEDSNITESDTSSMKSLLRIVESYLKMNERYEVNLAPAMNGLFISSQEL